MDDPLSDDEIRALGYEPGRRGWRLADPDAKPSRRLGLCRACQKFDGNPDWEGLCAGCLWFGPGDPHGLGRSQIRERLRKRIREAGA
jgi:hypothetical protein